MLRRTWPRFVLEACFLFAVALTAGWLDLSIAAIVAVMLAAYLATASLEWALARAGRPPGEPAAESHMPLETDPAPTDDDDALEIDWDDTPRDEPLTRERQEPVAETVPDPEPEEEPEPEPEPDSPEPEPEAEAEPDPEPEPVPVAPRSVSVVPELVAAPDLPVAAAPEPEPAPEPVTTLPLPSGPQEWNVWELERLVREHSGADPAREEEWSYLLVYLRDFASAEGTLSDDFDILVRESFGELLAGAR